MLKYSHFIISFEKKSYHIDTNYNSQQSSNQRRLFKVGIRKEEEEEEEGKLYET